MMTCHDHVPTALPKTVLKKHYFLSEKYGSVKSVLHQNFCEEKIGSGVQLMKFVLLHVRIQCKQRVQVKMPLKQDMHSNATLTF